MNRVKSNSQSLISVIIMRFVQNFSFERIVLSILFLELQDGDNTNISEHLNLMSKIDISIWTMSLTIAICGYFTMKKINRKPLIIFSSFGVGLTGIAFIIIRLSRGKLFSIQYDASYLYLTIGFAAQFLSSIALSSVPYFIAAELFKTNERTFATAIGTISACSADILFLIASLYSSLTISLMICTGLCLGLGAYVIAFLPETRNKAIL